MNTETPTFTFKDEVILDFKSNGNLLFASGNPVIAAKRESAINHFEKLGFPSKKHEEYKYMNMESLFKKGFSTHSVFANNITVKEIEKFRIVPYALVVVLVNGVYHRDLSDLEHSQPGVFISSFGNLPDSKKDILEKHFGKYADFSFDSFIALNTALAKDGVFIHIPENIQAGQPVHIIHIADSASKTIFQPRNLVVAEKNSEVTIIESFVSISSKGSFTNSLTEIFTAENARVNHFKIQNESDDSMQLNTLQAYQSRNSYFSSHSFSLSGAILRNNINIVADAENCESHLYGLYLTSGDQLVDNHTLVDHRKPNCYSNELYKGIMEGKSTAVFNGKIFVRQDAQKTNAFQSNKNILLSDDATINTKPQLEIYADDVKCSHGTSTGRMDEEAMFYLQARGIGKENARKLLLRAFVDEVIDTVKIEELRNHISDIVSKNLAESR
jgi:Fe-S cluster assembly protein SufD